MTREIRFRAWNKEEKWMEEVLPCPNAGLNKFLSDLSKTHFIMQFTGLKDKNGKEIYEGDVVKLSCFGDRNIIAIVEWFNEGHKYRVNIIDDDLRKSHDWNAGMHDCFRCMEIIGNIYENPELLDNKKIRGIKK